MSTLLVSYGNGICGVLVGFRQYDKDEMTYVKSGGEIPTGCTLHDLNIYFQFETEYKSDIDIEVFEFGGIDFNDDHVSLVMVEYDGSVTYKSNSIYYYDVCYSYKDIEIPNSGDVIELDAYIKIPSCPLCIISDGAGIKSVKLLFAIYNNDGVDTGKEEYLYHGDIVTYKHCLRQIEFELESGCSIDALEYYNYANSGDYINLIDKCISSFENDGYCSYTFDNLHFFSEYDEEQAFISVKTNACMLSLEEGTGTEIIVKRTLSSVGSTGYIKHGDLLFTGDKIDISYSALNGYLFAIRTIQGNGYNIKGCPKDGHVDHIVIENSDDMRLIVTATAMAVPYLLTINDTPNVTIIVKRVESPNFGAETCELKHGDSVYYGDMLTITIQAQEGFVISDVNIDNVFYSNLNTDTDELKICKGSVVGDIVVVATVSLKSYELLYWPSDDLNDIVTLRLKRISSPIAHASLGIVNDLDMVYYDDVLQDASIYTQQEYELKELIFNRKDKIKKYGTYVVPYMSNVVTLFVEGTIKRRDGLVSIDNGTSFDKYMIYIDNGTSWDRYLPYIDNGTSWDLYN